MVYREQQWGKGKIKESLIIKAQTNHLNLDTEASINNNWSLPQWLLFFFYPLFPHLLYHLFCLLCAFSFHLTTYYRLFVLPSNLTIYTTVSALAAFSPGHPGYLSQCIWGRSKHRNILHVHSWSTCKCCCTNSRDFAYKLFAFHCFGFCKAAPIPYVQAAILNRPRPYLMKKYHSTSW